MERMLCCAVQTQSILATLPARRHIHKSQMAAICKQWVLECTVLLKACKQSGIIAGGIVEGLFAMEKVTMKRECRPRRLFSVTTICGVPAILTVSQLLSDK